MSEETYTYSFEVLAVKYEIGRGLVLTARITAPEPVEQPMELEFNHITASFEAMMYLRGINVARLKKRGRWTEHEHNIIGGMIWDYAQKLTGDA